MSDSKDTVLDLCKLVQDMGKYIAKMSILHDDKGMMDAFDMFADRQKEIVRKWEVGIDG